MNYLQLELGGQKRGLKFDIGTLKVLRDQFDIDPFTFRTESNSLTELLPYATKIIYSAALRNLRVKKEPEDITYEQFESWVDELDIPTISLAVSCYNGIFVTKSPSANGEVGKDTQVNV
jgi:hypothetical protein